MTTERIIKRMAFLLFALMLAIGFCACGAGSSSDAMEFEPLEWPEYDNAKQIPIPNSNMAYVRNSTSRCFEFYLPDMSIDDYKSYVEECKTMGFTVSAIEQEQRYHAFNDAEYELTVQYQEESIMYVEVVEKRLDIEIKLLHTDKASADMYNLRIEIDGAWEADAEQGSEAISFDSYLKEGAHVLRVENDDDDNINGRLDFVASEDGEYIEFEIECLSNRINIRQLSGAQAEDSEADRGGDTDETVPNRSQNAENANPASETDFIYVNNGNEVQINGYKGNGGYVVIPAEIDGSPVTRIATGAFENAENITGVTLPEELQYIGDSAFFGLENLTGVLVIPETVTMIEGHAFQVTRITGLVIQSSCEVDINAFANIDSLEFVYVKEGCAPTIGTSAFCYAEALTIAIFPDSMTEIEDETFKACNNMVIYTTPGSFAESYANRNFISVNTESYAEQVEVFSELYRVDKTPVEEVYADAENSDNLFYANVLDTVNSLKQIHANPETIEILGAVVMNPESDTPRTIVYISYIGLDDNYYTDYFWKDLNGSEIKAMFAEAYYTGNNGRDTIRELDLYELANYEAGSTYVPNLSPTGKISVDR